MAAGTGVGKPWMSSLLTNDPLRSFTRLITPES